MSLYDCRMIELVPTTREPGRSFVDRMSALEGKDGVLSVSLGHGFQQGDVPEIGTRVLVITDNAKAAGDALATRLGEEIRSLKGQFAPPVVPLDEALDRALGSTAQRPERDRRFRPTMPAAARPPTTPTSSTACASAASPTRRSARSGTRSRSSSA